MEEFHVRNGRKDPLEYLKDRYKWITEAIVRKRLQSHLIPIQELANGGYGEMSNKEKAEKVKNDFNLFLRKRAELVIKVVKLLADGHQLSATNIFET